MKQGEWEGPSSEHEEVYHAATWCQAASLSLTPRRLHGLKKACSVEGKNTGAFALQCQAFLCSLESVLVLSLFKDRRIVVLLGEPHGIDDAYPDAREGAQRYGVAFSLLAFALVILPRPGLRASTLPSELVKR